MVVKKKNTKKHEIIQPQMNVGLVGHVDNGKTTLCQSLSGKWTDTHSEEIKRGITIRLGYADTSFYYCEKDNVYTVDKKCPVCKTDTTVLRKISLVDAPGHETLMATMLSGSAIMDAAILVVAANEDCPQPQTREHLMALQITGIKNIVIVQNKIDLVTKEEAVKNYEQIQNFVKGTIAENSSIIPMSALQRINLDALIEALVHIPLLERDSRTDPLMFVARSFDINKPGTKIKDLQGGVLGGALKQGVLKINDTIEIKPGRKIEREGKTFYEPLVSTVVGLRTGENNVQEVFPSGSLGVLTLLDPALVKSDRLTGNIVGFPGKLPLVWNELHLKPILLERVVGAKDELLVENIKKGEILMLNVNAAATVGIVQEMKKDIIYVTLKLPVCATQGDRITLSRRFGNRWRLIGYSTVK